MILKDEATKIIINTKGTVGEISDELKALIRYMDGGVITDDYTEALDAEIESVKSDEKVRMSYMLLQEAYARRELYGKYKTNVRQIRKNMNKTTVDFMSDFLDVSPNNCKSVIDSINAHPDWDDEQIADTIYWEK